MLVHNKSFETYLVSIITLALESDIGVKYGMSKKLDGIKAIKSGVRLDFTSEIVSCTKGDWNSRLASMQSIFGKEPDILRQNIKDLERIRKIRNNVAHSFGRDIQEAHEVHKLQRLPSEKLHCKQLLKYWNIIDECVREIDEIMFQQHIGEYQILCFYHDVQKEILSELNQNQHSTGNKARLFRKKYGKADKNGMQTLGAKFCKELIEYYDSI